ncbi:MAG: gamma carbonic anhydrase family protein [bacterium]
MICNFKGHKPGIHETAFIAESAELIGSVSLGEGASVWPQAVLRGDINSISVGRFSNIQDGAVLHVDSERSCTLGDYVTVGHMACLHACSVEDEALVGIGAIVLSGSRVSRHCIVGAGALVPEGTVLEEGHLYVGVPARKSRALTEEEKADFKMHALNYSNLACEYREGA